MAENQPPNEPNSESNSMTIHNMEKSQPMLAVADINPTYENIRVEPGRIKPHYLQVDTTLVEVMDSPLPPGHAWTSGLIVDILRTHLPDIREVVVAG